MKGAVYLVVLLAGCGETLDKGKVDAPPAQTDAAADATPDGTVSLGPFGAPSLLPGINSNMGEGDPSMTSDALELFFSSDRAGGMGGGDIWTAKRANTTAAWSTPTVVTELNSTVNEYSPMVSGDGLRMYLASSRPGGVGGVDIYVSARATRTTPWATPSLVTELNTATDEYRFTATDDGLTGVLDSTRGGATGRDLYITTRASTAAPWGVPVVVAELTTNGYEGAGCFGANRLTLYFRKDNDIYTATRSSVTGTFGAPVMLAELASPGNEADPWISADEHTILFSSSRGGAQTIYMATR